MKNTLLFVLCSLALNIYAQTPQKDTIDKYVIDKQVISHFDGSQLEGKTIFKYIIAYRNVGKFIEKNHVILTTPETATTTFDGLIIVDGKEVDANFQTKLKEEDIASISFCQPTSQIAKSYGEKGKKGVLILTTKANKDADELLYFIDGKIASKKNVEKLSPEKIASMVCNMEERAIFIETK